MTQINKTALDEALIALKSIDYKKDIPNKYLISIYEAAQAYADLPEKIEGMQMDLTEGEVGSLYWYEAVKYNQALDDILNLLKTEEK